MQGGTLLGRGEGPLALEHRATQGHCGLGGGIFHPVLGRLRILIPALELGGGKLGGHLGRYLMGIAPGESLLPPGGQFHPLLCLRAYLQGAHPGRILLGGSEQLHVPAVPLLGGTAWALEAQLIPQGLAVLPAQSGGEHPLGHAGGPRHLPGRRRALGLGRQLVQLQILAVDAGE